MLNKPRLRQKGQWWYLRFYDRNESPQRKTVALSTKNWKEAKVKAHVLEKRWYQGKYNPWSSSSVDLPTLVQLFLQSKERTLKPRSMLSLREVLIPFSEHRKGYIEHVSALDLEKYVSKEGLSPQTVKRRLVTVKGFISWCVEHGYIDSHKGLHLKAPKISPSPARFTTRKQACCILKTLRKARDGAERGMHDQALQWVIDAYLLGRLTGMRPSTLVQFDTSWIHESTIYVPEEANKTGAYTLPLFPATARLVHYVRPGEGLVLRGGAGNSIRPDHLSQVFMDHLRNKKDIPEWLTFYIATRHTFASWLVQEGVDIFLVSQWLGHKDVRTTMRYAHLRPDQQSTKANNLFK